MIGRSQHAMEQWLSSIDSNRIARDERRHGRCKEDDGGRTLGLGAETAAVVVTSTGTNCRLYSERISIQPTGFNDAGSDGVHSDAPM